MRNIALALLLLLAFATAHAQPTLSAVRAAARPTIDGEVSDPVWATAAAALSFVDPFTGQAPMDGTEARVLFDGEALYVSFVCRDSNPAGIVGREVRPGAEFEGEDVVTFTIDPFYARREGTVNEFSVNVLGTQSESIAGGRSAKREWRGEWNAATRRVDDGWTVEMRIPWRMLNRPGAGVRTIGINFSRFQARTRVLSEWSNRTPAERPELIGKLEGVEVPKGALAQKFNGLVYAAPEWTNGDGTSLRSGLDARYAFTDTFTAVASVNPDFRNIEQAVEDISFTRSERFLSDARPFFTEGRDFFELTGRYTFGRMFFSRRIESFDWGAKAFGRIGRGTSVGALATVEGNHRTDAVFHLKHELTPLATISGYGTMRDDRGAQNTAMGSNFVIRSGNFSGDAMVAASEDAGVRDTAGSAAFIYEIPRVYAMVRYIWVEPLFNPALGLIPFTDLRGGYFYANHEAEYRTGPLRTLNVELFAEQYDHYDGSPFNHFAGLDFEGTLRNDLSWSLGHERGAFEGEHDDLLKLGATVNSSNRYKRLGLEYQWGKLGDASSQFLSISGSYRAFGKVDLGLTSTMFRLMGTDRQNILTIGWELDAKRSVTGRIADRNGDVNAYLTYRNSGFSGMETYVILGDPNAAKFQRRLSIKLVWAF